jgi:hypothetical protein
MYAGKMATKQTWWRNDDGHLKTGIEVLVIGQLNAQILVL